MVTACAIATDLDSNLRIASFSASAKQIRERALATSRVTSGGRPRRSLPLDSHSGMTVSARYFSMPAARHSKSAAELICSSPRLRSASDTPKSRSY